MHQRAGIQGPEGGLGSDRVRQSDSSVVEVLQGRMSWTHVSLWVEWKKAGEFLSHSSVLSVKLVPQTLYPTHLLNTHVQTLLQLGLRLLPLLALILGLPAQPQVKLFMGSLLPVPSLLTKRCSVQRNALCLFSRDLVIPKLLKWQ